MLGLAAKSNSSTYQGPAEARPQRRSVWPERLFSHVGVSLSKSYRRDERATRDLFDDEGFLDTGDIVEQRGPDTLVWIERAKNVLKLAHREFVATSRLEEIYAARSPFIRQVFLHGDSFYSYLLAVLVPELEAVGRLANDDASMKGVLRAELDRIAREEKLRS